MCYLLQEMKIKAIHQRKIHEAHNWNLNPWTSVIFEIFNRVSVTQLHVVSFEVELLVPDSFFCRLICTDKSLVVCFQPDWYIWSAYLYILLKTPSIECSCYKSKMAEYAAGLLWKPLSKTSNKWASWHQIVLKGFFSNSFFSSNQLSSIFVAGKTSLGLSKILLTSWQRFSDAPASLNFLDLMAT